MKNFFRINGDKRFKYAFSAVFIIMSLMIWQTASAKWQYIEWDMTPDEVVTASEGKAVKLDPSKKVKGGLIKAVVADHKNNDFSFKVSFLFDPVTEKLQCVVLKLVDMQDASSVYQDLVKAYGKPGNSYYTPASSGDSIKAVWPDIAGKKAVKYFSVDDMCFIEYRPVKEADN